jgi:hypothetical protein
MGLARENPVIFSEPDLQSLLDMCRHPGVGGRLAHPNDPAGTLVEIFHIRTCPVRDPH